MVINIKDNLKIFNFMVKEFKFLKMEIDSKEIIKMVKGQEKEFNI